MDEPDEIIVGCASRVRDPEVPSQPIECDACGSPLWISDAMLDELQDLHGEAVAFSPRCAMTCMGDEIKASISPSQRAALHERGISDDQIDLLVALVNQLRGAESGDSA